MAGEEPATGEFADFALGGTGDVYSLLDANEERSGDALRASERELRLIIQSLAGMICIFSPAGELISGNQQLLDYFREPLEEIGRWATNGTTHPDDLEHCIACFTKSLASGEPYDFETRFRRFDGAFRWFQVRGHPLRRPDGEIIRWYGLLTDIDDRKRAEEALRASEIDLRLTLDSLPGLVCTFSADGRFEGGNQRFYDYLDIDRDSAEAWASKGPAHPDDKDRAIAVFREAMITGEPYMYEARARCFDGVYRWFQVVGRPHRDDEGRLVRWYSLLVEVDDRKRAERELEASERNLRLTIDTIPALAWSARPDGSTDFLNQHYLDYVGQPLERLLEWQWISFIHPDDLPSLTAAWTGFRSRGQGGEAEARIRRHDGQYRWFLFRVDALRDEAGDIVKWYGVNTDIEDRKLAEAALQRSETFLAEGQRISATGSFSWQVDSDELTFSAELYRIFEFRPGDVVTLDDIAARVHPEDQALLAARMAEIRSGSDNPEYEIRLVMPSDRVKHVSVFGRIVRHDDGRTECFGAVQDVTLRKQAEEGLHEVRSELAHVTRVLSFSALTASIAHEINQPLSGIITNANTCLRMLAADPPRIDTALETVQRTIRDGRRAADIVARLRKLYSKKTERSDSVDINDAAAEVVALLSADLQRKRVIVRTEFSADLPPIPADRVQLQQVILNMITNAAEAMSGVEGRERALTIRTDRDGSGGIILSVQDVGIGLGGDSPEDVFRPFFTTKPTGMGIGLSVSRSIVESHGGRLWAVPNEGEGATFSFAIPQSAETLEGSAPALDGAGS
ncbi:PAS domain-containing sensor histidine kinase [Sphingomonas daechungensis]|uniref:PAS domain-containing sensor histidine kinase n=1 Tax=Sphingomonas daechungensis TaxID=1176646 RepID=UPI0031E6F162